MASIERTGMLWLVSLVVPVLAAAPLDAQGRPFRERSRVVADDIDFSEFNLPYSGRFRFVRLRFAADRYGWGRGGYFGGNFWWDHDYPRAERHFMRILSEFTTLVPDADGKASNILALDDPELLKYPVAYMSEPGHWTMTEHEEAGLRDYLLKGGFVIFDDFEGSDWFNFEAMMQRVLPGHRLVQLDPSHPIFHSFFEIESFEGFVHPYSGWPASFYGVFEDNDPGKRLMIVANYNNDIGESWEFSDTGFIPIDLTNEAFKLGINYVVYAMTH